MKPEQLDEYEAWAIAGGHKIARDLIIALRNDRAEIARLQASNSRLSLLFDGITSDIALARQYYSVARLECKRASSGLKNAADLKIAIDALRFYTDEDDWATEEILHDRGDRAKAALAVMGLACP